MPSVVLRVLFPWYLMLAESQLINTGFHAISLTGCGVNGASCQLGGEPPSLSLLQSHAVSLSKAGAGDSGASDFVGQPEAVDAGSSGNSTSTADGTTSTPVEGAITPAVAGSWLVVVVCLLGFCALLAMRRDPEEGPGLPKFASEFVGTFMLVFSVGCNVLVGDATWGIVSIACTLMVAIYAFAHVSGGNLNPAVSLALGLSGKMPWVDVGIYICTQLAAGIVAALTYGVMLGQTFNLGPAAGHSWWQAGLAEVIYTFMLCFMVLNSAASEKHGGKDQFYGLTIGFSVIAGGYGAGSISGGCFNPAVAFGIDASSTSLGFGWCFAYLVFEVIGAGLAAVFFRLCRPEDFDQTLAGRESSVFSCFLSEFLGTYMLVLTVGLNVLASSKAAVFSIAASLTCMIFALGSVSGAHFNPAVTTAVYCSGRGKIKLSRATVYVLVQVLGGVAAAFTFQAMQNGKTVSLRPSKSLGQALVGEVFFTFLLSFVVLCVATVKSPLSQFFGLAIGSCVTAGGLAIGSLSGGSLNPAVSVGLAVSDTVNKGSMHFLLSYVVVELAGGLLAAVIFRLTHWDEFPTNGKHANGNGTSSAAKA